MPAAPLTAQQLDHFRAKLEAMRTTLQREIEAMPSLTDDDAIRIGDQTDQASAESEREFEVVNLARALKLLNEVDRAIVRIDNGIYGLCEETGEPIGLKRLEAQPTATLSIEAQERRERV